MHNKEFASMNYEYYKIFNCVGKHKNITRAAEELYSSQPAVTRAIQKMEAELNCRLFVRTKSGVEFTHEGQTLYRYSSAACGQLDKAEEELRQAAGLNGGSVYIGATVTALHCFLFDFMDKFHRLYPNVRFKIRTDSSDKTIERLKSGSVDIAFVTTPCNAPKPLETVKIKTFRDVLIAGNLYAKLKDETLGFEDLKKYPFIGLTKGMQLRQFIDDNFAANGISVKPDIELDGADLIVPMVTHNRGLAFVPEGITAEAVDRGDIFKVNFTGDLPHRHVCVISNPRHVQSTASCELHKMIISSVK